MNTYSEKITQLQADKIKQILISDNAVFDSVQYSNWRAKTSSYQVIYYTSGKILIQGKDITSVCKKIDVILGKISEDNKNSSEQTIFEKYIGTDESGKGDFFGPLVVAGVLVNDSNKQKFIDIGVKDSKKLDDNKILKLASFIKANAEHSVIVMMPKKYNELYLKFQNLNKLLAWGHARAIENILEKSDCNYAIADKFGDESLINNALMSKGRNIKLKQMVRAESYIAVAAASILARAEFVKRMDELEKKYELHFSKGVSSKVLEEAKQYIDIYSYERLDEVSKIHFKTVNELK